MFEESESDPRADLPRADLPHPDLAVLSIVPVPGLACWSVRITVDHADGACTGWAPFVFWSYQAADAWLDARSGQPVRPAVRECTEGPNDRAYAAIVDDRSADLLVSEPVSRVKAAGIAALFAAEFRAYSHREV